MEEVHQRFPEVQCHPGMSGTQSMKCSIDKMMGFMDCVANSDQLVIDDAMQFLEEEGGQPDKQIFLVSLL